MKRNNPGYFLTGDNLLHSVIHLLPLVTLSCAILTVETSRVVCDDSYYNATCTRLLATSRSDSMRASQELRLTVRAAIWLSAVTTIVAVVLVTPAPLVGQSSAAPDVTFTKDIAPILQRSCQNCHRPGSVAPMPLLTYEDARPYAAAIKRRTGIRSKQGTMPPWYIEKGIGIQHYKNDISLSDEEVARIARWADSGAPRGNPADM